MTMFQRIEKTWMSRSSDAAMVRVLRTRSWR